MLGQPIRVVGASRTDAGVHALGQIVSVCTESAMEPATVQRALNALLPAAVRVLDARDGPSGFDARRWSSGKRYLYLIDRGRVAHPLLRRFAWHVPGRLDPEAMRKAALTLRGRHDFSAFCAASGRGRTPFCTVGSIRLVARKERVAILVSADSFLHHMVRNVVGSLVEVGRGARAPEWIPDVLVSRDRTRAGRTAPAHGLTLLRVTYRRDKRDVPRVPTVES